MSQFRGNAKVISSYYDLPHYCEKHPLLNSYVVDIVEVTNTKSKDFHKGGTTYKVYYMDKQDIDGHADESKYYFTYFIPDPKDEEIEEILSQMSKEAELK